MFGSSLPEKLATYGTQDEDKQNTRITQYVGHQYTQTHTNNVNKTCAFLQTTGGKEEPNIVLCVNRNEHHNMELRLETLCIDVVYIANWSTKNIKKKYL
jgi:hypothetical protein